MPKFLWNFCIIFVMFFIFFIFTNVAASRIIQPGEPRVGNLNMELIEFVLTPMPCALFQQKECQYELFHK
jgi:hypothetical protein